MAEKKKHPSLSEVYWRLRCKLNLHGSRRVWRLAAYCYWCGHPAGAGWPHRWMT